MPLPRHPQNAKQMAFWRWRDGAPIDVLSEHTQQRLPQVRMCLRVRNVSPECSTWLNLGSWGWGRLHSNVGHPKSKRENANLVDRNHISTHRFSGQKMGGEALVPHSLHDLGSRSSPPHLFLLSHWLALLWPPFEMLVSWHPAFLKTSVTNNALCVAGERSSDHRLHLYRDCYGPSHRALDHR